MPKSLIVTSIIIISPFYPHSIVFKRVPHTDGDKCTVLKYLTVILFQLLAYEDSITNISLIAILGKSYYQK